MNPPPYNMGHPVFPESIRGPSFSNYLPDNSSPSEISTVLNANHNGQVQLEARDPSAIPRRLPQSMTPCSYNLSQRVNPSLQSGGIFTSPNELCGPFMNIHADPEFYPYNYDAVNESTLAQLHRTRMRPEVSATHLQGAQLGALDLTHQAEQQTVNDAYLQAFLQRCKSQNRLNQDFSMPPHVQDSGRYSAISEFPAPDMTDAVRNGANSYRRNDCQNMNHTLTGAEGQIYQMPNSFQAQVGDIPIVNPQVNPSYYYPNDGKQRQHFAPPNMVAPSHQHMNTFYNKMKFQWNPFGLNSETVVIDPNMIGQRIPNPENLRNLRNTQEKINHVNSSVDMNHLNSRERSRVIANSSVEINRLNPKEISHKHAPSSSADISLLNSSSSSTAQYMQQGPAAYNNQALSTQKKRKPEVEREISGKRTRHVFSHSQLEVLEAHYSDSRYCKVNDRQTLADDLGVSEKQVKVWFQNRRSRDSRKLQNCHNVNGDGLQETRKGRRGPKKKCVKQLEPEVQNNFSRIHNSSYSMIETRSKKERSDSETSSEPEVVFFKGGQRGRPKHKKTTPVRNPMIGNHSVYPNSDNHVPNINNLLLSSQTLNPQNFLPNPGNQQPYILINNQINNKLQQVFVPDYSLPINRQPGKIPNNFGLPIISVNTSPSNAAQDVSGVHSYTTNNSLNHGISQPQGASFQNRRNILQQEPTHNLNVISQENRNRNVSLDKQHKLSKETLRRDEETQEGSSKLQSTPSKSTYDMSSSDNQLEILSKLTDTYCSSSKPRSSDKNPGGTNILDKNSNTVKNVHKQLTSAVNSTEIISGQIQNSDDVNVAVTNNSNMENSAITEATSKTLCKNGKEISPKSEIFISDEVNCQASTNKCENSSDIILISEVRNPTYNKENGHKPQQKPQKETEIKPTSVRESNSLLGSESNKELNVYNTPTTECDASENHECNGRSLTSLKNTTSTVDTYTKSRTSILGKTSKYSTLYPSPRNSFRFNDNDNYIEYTDQSSEWNFISNSNIEDPFASQSDDFTLTGSTNDTFESTASTSQMMFNNSLTSVAETSHCSTLIGSMLGKNNFRLTNSESETSSKSVMEFLMSSNEILNGITANDTSEFFTISPPQRNRNIPTVPIKVENVTEDNTILSARNGNINTEARNLDFVPERSVRQNPFSSDELPKQNLRPGEMAGPSCPSYLSLYDVPDNAQFNNFTNLQNCTNFTPGDKDYVNNQNQFTDYHDLSDMLKSKTQNALGSDFLNVEIKEEPQESLEYYEQQDMTQFDCLNGSTLELFNTFPGMVDPTTVNCNEFNKSANTFEENAKDNLSTNQNCSSSQITVHSPNVFNPFRENFSTKKDSLKLNTKNDPEISFQGKSQVTNDLIMSKLQVSEVSEAKFNSLLEKSHVSTLNPSRSNEQLKSDSIQAEGTLNKFNLDMRSSETNNSENISKTQYYTGPLLPRQGYNHMVSNMGGLCELKSESTSLEEERASI